MVRAPGSVVVCLAGLAPLSSCRRRHTPTGPEVPFVPPHFVLGWGRLGSGDGAFPFAGGVAVDRNRDVYVAAFNDRRVQKFNR